MRMRGGRGTLGGMGARGPRSGMTVVELLIAMSLGLSILGFVIQGLRWASVRTADSTDEIAKVREVSLFMERLRRVLRLDVERIERTPTGMVVHHWVRGTEGTRRLVQTSFDGDEQGGVLIREGGGAPTRYQVGEPGSRVRLAPAETGAGVRVDLGGVELVPGAARVRPMQRADGSLLARGGTLSTLALPPEWAVPGGAGLDGAGEARIERTEGAAPPETQGPATVPGGSSPSSGGIDLEVDVLPAEIHPVGETLLRAPEGLAGLAPTGADVLADRLEDAGLEAARAAELAAALAAYEKALLERNRRAAAVAVVGLIAAGKKAGLSDAALGELAASVSPVAGRMAGKRERVVAGPEPATPPPIWISPSLWTNGSGPDAGAALAPGTLPEAPAGEATDPVPLTDPTGGAAPPAPPAGEAAPTPTPDPVPDPIPETGSDGTSSGGVTGAPAKDDSFGEPFPTPDPSLEPPLVPIRSGRPRTRLQPATEAPTATAEPTPVETPSPTPTPSATPAATPPMTGLPMDPAVETATAPQSLEEAPAGDVPLEGGSSSPPVGPEDPAAPGEPVQAPPAGDPPPSGGGGGDPDGDGSRGGSRSPLAPPSSQQ